MRIRALTLAGVTTAALALSAAPALAAYSPPAPGSAGSVPGVGNVTTAQTVGAKAAKITVNSKALGTLSVAVSKGSFAAGGVVAIAPVSKAAESKVLKTAGFGRYTYLKGTAVLFAGAGNRSVRAAKPVTVTQKLSPMPTNLRVLEVLSNKSVVAVTPVVVNIKKGTVTVTITKPGALLLVSR